MIMGNRVSFKSNINFVSINQFNSFKKGDYIDYKKDFINAVCSPEFYTESVMDCTAGGIVDPDKKKSVGFHINGLYMLNSPPFEIIGKAKNGLIIGSKKIKYSVNSLHNFEIIKKYFSEKVQNLSVLGPYRYNEAMSDVHYSLKNDTWTINTIFYKWMFGKMKEVTSLKNLLSAFKEIKISKGDRLFIEEREVLPKDCPEIFE